MTREHRRPIAPLVAAIFSLLALPASAQPVEAPPVAPPSLHTRTFEAAWRLVRDTHFDTTYNGVDWDAVHDEFAPRAREAQTTAQVRGIISDMLSRLGESHFALIPADVADVLPGEDDVEPAADTDPAPNTDTSGPDGATDGRPGGQGESGGEGTDPGSDWLDEPLDNESYGGGDAWLGLDVRTIDGRLVVTRVEPGSPAEQAGVHPGWIIEMIGRRDVARRLEALSRLDAGSDEIIAWQIFTSMLAGNPRTAARLTLLDADDTTRRLTLERVRQPGQMAKFGNLPTMNSHLEWSWLDADEFDIPDNARVGLIRFNIFMMPTSRQFERAVFELRGADGIIIDVRGNLGGIGALAIGMGGRLIDKPVSLGTMQMRGAALKFNISPQYVTSWGEPTEPFKGRVAVLTDPVSASTSEVFAGGLQAVGRARVFGQTTAGMALPAAMDRLPNGDVLLHAIADYHTSKGDRLEKTGVIPDVPVPLTREDLLAGIDAPLARAAAWAATGEE